MKVMHIMNSGRMVLIGMCLLMTACNATDNGEDFVTARDGQFYCNGEPYRYVGTNFWYGAILGSEGQGGNRERLSAELDSLHALGLDNLRILVGAEGATQKQSLVWPTLQTAPGVYNDTLFAGLDWLLQEMSERKMKAVLYLNNAWEWSGGIAQYLEWAGEGPALDPTRDGYNEYCSYVARFATNTQAQQLFFNHVRTVVSRTNSYNQRRYADDPTIMAWQIANEPRPFRNDSTTMDGFKAWIAQTAAIIKAIDSRHLVSVGSEGLVGCENSIECFEEIHANPDIDYLTIHIWPMNWGWVTHDEVRQDTAGTDTALMQRVLTLTDAYVREHLDIASRLGKPLVIEEFGYARDGYRFDLSAPTHARDAYYSHMFTLPDSFPTLCGLNFWAWSGLARPTSIRWQPFHDYCGDPAQEEQGLYSVFLSDTSTINLLRRACH